MSAIVLQFVGKPKPKAAAPSEKSHYFCQRCQGEQFKAFENGKMRCASCGVGIKNLTVTFHPESA